MAFKMKGFSGFKHTIAQGHKAIKDIPHTHKVNPISKDKDEITGEVYSDEEIIERDEEGKVDLTTPGFVEEEEEIPEGSYYIDTGDGKKTLYTPPKKKKKRRRGGIKRWFRRNINLRGGVRPTF